MNIVGEGFNSKIVEQIKQRQKIYGSINRNNNELNYLNTKTGWCRLVSSVDVNDDSATIRNLGLTGTKLASKYVLFSGIQAGGQTRAGVSPSNDLHSPYAYGLGGTEFGLRPMPGIKNARITTETRGSIKKATLQIQANNRFQFDIIDILYMRLGYSVLLEWGSSSYYTNNGTYVKDNPHSLADIFLNKGTYTYTDENNVEKTVDVNYQTILNIIQSKRLVSCGNYDALFAKVVNFTWTYTKEGTYDITINLISLGDVIESLKANNLLTGLQETNYQSQLSAEQAAAAEQAANQTIPNVYMQIPVADTIVNGTIDAINALINWGDESIESVAENENLF
jgi:hypothetical protein